MEEIGGYIEFPEYKGDIFHTNAIALNSARNCLAYLIESKKINKITVPKFLCDSVSSVCKKYGINVRRYSINVDFMPNDKLKLEDDEWLYFVNYYGQFNNEQIAKIKKKYDRVIIDNVQAYFQMPLGDTDTIYTCRKFFGVPDGAFLYTDKKLNCDLENDVSMNRMSHLLGRLEENANKHYSEYIVNEEAFINLPIRKMSLLTENLLRSIDYKIVQITRERNFLYLDNKLGVYNKLKLQVPVGAFMYPLYLANGADIRKKLQEEKIYIPTLWPDVFDVCNESDLEYDMAKNILPIPCDQRYEFEDMKFIVDEILKYIS